MKRTLLGLATAAALLLPVSTRPPAAAADPPVVTAVPVGPPTAAAGIRVQWTFPNEFDNHRAWLRVQREGLGSVWLSDKAQGSMDDTAVQQGQSYRYHVCADNDNRVLCSDWISVQASDGGSAAGAPSPSLLAWPTLPESATDVRATNITSTSATITWQPGPAASWTEVAYVSHVDAVWLPSMDGANVYTTTGSSDPITGLKPNSWYDVRVWGKSTPTTDFHSATVLTFQTELAASELTRTGSILPSAGMPITGSEKPITASGLERTGSILPSAGLDPQVSAPPTYRDPSIVGGWPQLSSLTQGEAVRSLQYLLRHSGGSLAADGKFGPETDAAVRDFQKARGLTVDGVVGPVTWQALIVTVQQGSFGQAVRAAQSQLNAHGAGLVVDGDFGALTDAAGRNYQQSHGLVVDGIVGPSTWQALLAGK